MDRDEQSARVPPWRRKRPTFTAIGRSEIAPSRGDIATRLRYTEKLKQSTFATSALIFLIWDGYRWLPERKFQKAFADLLFSERADAANTDHAAGWPRGFARTGVWSPLGIFLTYCRLGTQAHDGNSRRIFPTLSIDSADNVILLCEEHHRLIDREEVEKHPPALLFEMARRKADFISHAVDDLFVSSPFRFDHEEVLEDTRIGRIFDLMNEARLAGPKRGREALGRADLVLRDIVKNPFVKIPEELIELIKLEITTNGCVNAYDPNAWRSALDRAKTCLRKNS